MSETRTLVLVDGSSYIYRAFFGLPALSSSRGEPTHAVLGVVNMLNKLLKDYTPDLIAVVFDAPGRTFRDELFAEYKAHREPMPDDLNRQVEPTLQIVQAQGLPLLRMEGVEADDVIGTLACRASRENIRVVISTGDKDMAQLVDGNICCVNTMTGTTLDRAGVKAKFDVWPEQIVDYLALVGDSSDNIPGVPKVGPKTAAKWLAQYGTLDNLIANAAQVEGKVGESLRENLTALELSRKLATINTDLTLDVAPGDLRRGAGNLEQLRALYARLELNSLLRQLNANAAPSEASGALTLTASPNGPRADSSAPAAVAAPLPASAESATVVAGQAPPPPPPVPRHYETVVTEEHLEAWVARLQAATLISFDTETDSVEYMRAGIVGLSFCVEPGIAAYVPLTHDYAGAPDQLDRTRTLEKLRPILENESIGKVGHHLKFDAHVLANHGIELRGMRYDSMLESYVLNSTATRHDMDASALRYLGVQTIHFEDVAGKGARQLTFNQVPVDRAAEYAAEDADITLQLHRVLWAALEREPRLQKLYVEIEQPLVPVLQRMEAAGVLIDREMLKRQSAELIKRMQEIEAAAHREAGAPFSLDSPKQLQEILFNRMQIPVVSKTASGQPSTAENVLEELAESYTLPRLIMEYRGCAKLRSTYTEKLPEQINPRTGRVHTCYNQAVAATGRLSSTDPNLQNIPIRTPEGRRIRQAFVAPPGHVLMAADYSQIELRIMAHLSGDDGLLAAFAEDRDIHQATAAEVFGLPPDQVSGDQRRSAKAINFGLIYGMSAFGLARQLGIERNAAQRYVDLYFERYPGVKRFMDTTRTQARELGYVETVFGRRLYLPDIRSRNNAMRQYAERSAINAPMQGTAADIIKRAMIRVDAWLRSERVPARLLMQVHDELVFEVAEGAVESVREQVRAHMSESATLRVPLRVDVGTGANWDEAH
ncbi:MAG TPA: DNA polymerase I [Steroidobacteraceae bacterium]|nr:DNA polymerase I [Steroidobacteraceae bacterium]